MYGDWFKYYLNQLLSKKSHIWVCWLSILNINDENKNENEKEDCQWISASSHVYLNEMEGIVFFYENMFY